MQADHVRDGCAAFRGPIKNPPDVTAKVAPPTAAGPSLQAKVSSAPGPKADGWAGPNRRSPETLGERLLPSRLTNVQKRKRHVYTTFSKPAKK